MAGWIRGFTGGLTGCFGGNMCPGGFFLCSKNFLTQRLWQPKYWVLIGTGVATSVKTYIDLFKTTDVLETEFEKQAGFGKIYEEKLKRFSNCEVDKSFVRMVKCSMLFHFPALAPSNGIRYAQMTENFFQVIPQYGFAELARLTTIEISGNSALIKIERGAFHGLPYLEKLLIRNHPSLTKLYAKTFSGAPNLTELYIDNNEGLNDIERGAFDDLHFLKTLSLTYNAIQLVPEFPNSANIVDMFLCCNHIRLIGENTFWYQFQKPANNSRVDLSYNRFQHDIQPRAFHPNCTLKEIDLRGTHVGCATIEFLPKSILIIRTDGELKCNNSRLVYNQRETNSTKAAVTRATKKRRNTRDARRAEEQASIADAVKVAAAKNLQRAVLIVVWIITTIGVILVIRHQQKLVNKKMAAKVSREAKASQKKIKSKRKSGTISSKNSKKSRGR